MVAELNGAGVYSPDTVDSFVELFLADASRDRLDPLLDAAVAEYVELLAEDDQVSFQGTAKGFLRT